MTGRSQTSRPHGLVRQSQKLTAGTQPKINEKSTFFEECGMSLQHSTAIVLGVPDVPGFQRQFMI